MNPFNDLFIICIKTHTISISYEFLMSLYLSETYDE